jgi:hypothetical protein
MEALSTANAGESDTQHSVHDQDINPETQPGNDIFWFSKFFWCVMYDVVADFAENSDPLLFKFRESMIAAHEVGNLFSIKQTCTYSLK